MLLKVKKNTSSETEYDSIEYLLSMPRTQSNEVAVVSEIPYVINDENVIIAPGQEKNSFNFK